jgi:hypothetical protein
MSPKSGSLAGQELLVLYGRLKVIKKKGNRETEALQEVLKANILHLWQDTGRSERKAPDNIRNLTHVCPWHKFSDLSSHLIQ